MKVPAYRFVLVRSPKNRRQPYAHRLRHLFASLGLACAALIWLFTTVAPTIADRPLPTPPSPDFIPGTTTHTPAADNVTAAASATQNNVDSDIGLATAPDWLSDDVDYSTYLAWGDVDGDGDLDLAVANGGTLNGFNPDAQNTAVYLNVNGRLQEIPIWTSPYDEESRSVAWGDVDGDGDLDLAVANLNRNTVGQPNRIFRNDGSGVDADGNPILRLVDAWTDPFPDRDSGDVAWGDYNGDGRLDLAVGNGAGFTNAPSVIYRNDGLDGSGSVQLTAITQTITASTTAVAWADYDDDGDLDLALGNLNAPNRVYENDAGTFRLGGGFGWEAPTTENTYSLAWGDLNNDDRLDLAVGNLGEPNQLFLNDGATLSATAAWTETVSSDTARISLGDVDNDGDLDLAVANIAFPGDAEPVTQVYLNGGFTAPNTLSMTLGWQSNVDAEQVSGVAWGDVDGDGDLDLAASIWPKPNLLFLNQSGALQATPIFTDAGSVGTVAWGDIDNDDDLDLAIDGGFFRNQAGTLQFEAVPEIFGPVAWGDANRDGYLDLTDGYALFGNVPGANGRTLTVTQILPGTGLVSDVAWGDVNSDGHLDLAIAGEETMVLFNDGTGFLSTTNMWTAKIVTGTTTTTAIAWGDVDQDGDLDLAASTGVGGLNYVYLNDNGFLDETAAFTFGDPDDEVQDLAWGDGDGDGDLDIALGVRDKPNHVFRNDNGIIHSTAVWSSADIDDTTGIAWIDVDGDGDQDLTAGNFGDADKLYLNENGILNRIPAWQTEDTFNTFAVAWGDVNRDGEPDLAVANDDALRIYRGQQPQQPNTIGETAVRLSLNSTPLPLGGGSSSPSLAAADFYATPGIRDDGTVPVSYTLTHPDSAAVHFVRAYFSPDGGGSWQEVVPATGTQTTTLATSPTGVTHTFLWDVHASGFFGQSDSVVFRLEAYGGASPATADGGAVDSYQYTNSAPAPYQRPFLATQSYPFRVRGTQIRVVDTGGQPVGDALVYRLPAGQTIGADPLVDTLQIPFRTNEFGFLQGRGRIAPGDQLVALHPIGYGGETEKSLNFDGFDDYVDFGNVAATDNLTNDFTVSAWVKPDRVVGVQRILSHARTNGANGIGFGIVNGGLRLTTYNVRDYDSTTIALRPGEWAHVAAVMGADNSVTFYVNGVYQETLFHPTPGLPNNDGDKLMLGAISAVGSDFLFEYLNGSLSDVRIWSTARTPQQIQSEFNDSLTTADEAGLIAYWPIDEGSGDTITDLAAGITGTLGGGDDGRRPAWIDDGIPLDPTYVVYETSATPTATGLQMTAVPPNPGIITLTVDPANSLTLFNLDVSLEWDSRRDPTYLEQLESDLRRTSQILFDLSDGQAALGDVTLFQDKDNWLDADVVVHAGNNQRPNANLGGIVQSVVSETLKSTDVMTNAYLPGQIRMGATWNRFGNSSGNLGEDWPRALAHEIGHYAFFLLDNYLGINSDGVLVETRCLGSAMTDAYVESEFLTPGQWSGDCLESLAEKTTGRSDWETVSEFYPWMTAVSRFEGPANLPLNVTDVTFTRLDQAANTLDAPFFALQDESGAPLVFGESQAQAYLYKTNDDNDPTNDAIVALGAPNRDLVHARGAEPGDRLCVYGTEPTRVGCHDVGTQEAPFTVAQVANWPPQMTVTAVNSRTFTVAVTDLQGVNGLGVQLLPVFGAASDEQITGGLGGQTAVSLTVTLDTPAPGGVVRLWVPGSTPTKEAVTHFFLGGGWNVNRPGLNVNRPGLNVNRPGLNVNRPGLNAPIASSDGQVIIFSLDNLFDDVITHSLQSLVTPPLLDPWLTPVGQAYRFTSDGALPNSSITFYYLQRDVPAGHEESLTLYYQADGDDVWQRLDTVLDTYRNFASAPLQEEGTYVLAATIETPALRRGWNLFAYPNTDAQTMPEALASIDGDYTSVYRWQNQTDPPQWQLYDATVPAKFQALVNDLPSLQPLRSYWIYAITDTVPYIRVPGSNLALQTPSLPPATYYGEVNGTATFTPAVGMSVTAVVNGVTCGQGTVQSLHGEPVYKVQVAADSGSGCGTPTRSVTFQVGGVTMAQRPLWSHTQANYLPLSDQIQVTHRLFLPQIVNQHSGGGSSAVAPDLVVDQIVATESQVQVVIKNQGTAAVPAGSDFWVDVYVDPDPPPTAVNQIWELIADEGLVWGITGGALPLAPGESLTLTNGDGYYWPTESVFSGTLPPGTPIYAQVDSANVNTGYGAVLEGHEQSGGAYNNILGPVASQPDPVNLSPTVRRTAVDPTHRLPPRR